jgi:steroid 5-alpha reductase family enzyme
VVLRQKISPFLFQVTNLVFTSGIQNILLFALGLPTLTAAVLQPHTSLATSDYLLAFMAIMVLAIEFTADNQQYAFHAYKHAFIAQKENDTSKKYEPHQHWFGARLNWQPQDAERGFCTKGLWAFSRHPNFACEQTFWVCNFFESPSLAILKRWM